MTKQILMGAVASMSLGLGACEKGDKGARDLEQELSREGHSQEQPQPGTQPGMPPGSPGEAEPGAGEREPTGGREAASLEEALTTPEKFFDRDVMGTAVVDQVVNGSAFFAKVQGKRILVVMGDGGGPKPTFQPGQNIVLEGRLEDAKKVSDLPSEVEPIVKLERAVILAQRIGPAGPGGEPAAPPSGTPTP